MENVIVKMRFGSQLYGTATPESDQDYKGVFLPRIGEVLVGRLPKSLRFDTKTGNDRRNTSEDVDCELYSLQYFIDLACQGQTVALDMLHAPESCILETSDLWKRIVSNRERFYTKNINAFVGYARRQAAKYGLKGGRLASAKAVLSIIEVCSDETRLIEVWDSIPVVDHVHKFVDANDRAVVQVCGKKFHGTVKVPMLRDSLGKFIREYGSRAEAAQQNQNIDWKAMSHAVRAAEEVRQILVDKTIKFPLANADYLIAIKTGRVAYKEVSADLEDTMDLLDSLVKLSTLPEKADRKWWEGVVIGAYFPL